MGFSSTKVYSGMFSSWTSLRFSGLIPVAEASKDDVLRAAVRYAVALAAGLNEIAADKLDWAESYPFAKVVSAQISNAPKTRVGIATHEDAKPLVLNDGIDFYELSEEQIAGLDREGRERYATYVELYDPRNRLRKLEAGFALNILKTQWGIEQPLDVDSRTLSDCIEQIGAPIPSGSLLSIYV